MNIHNFSFKGSEAVLGDPVPSKKHRKTLLVLHSVDWCLSPLPLLLPLPLPLVCVSHDCYITQRQAQKSAVSECYHSVQKVKLKVPGGKHLRLRLDGPALDEILAKSPKSPLRAALKVEKSVKQI